MLLLLACAARAPAPPPPTEAAPPSPTLSPAVVRVRFDREVRREYRAHLEVGDPAAGVVMTWRGTATRSALGPTRLPSGEATSSIPLLRCEVRDGALTVIQRPEGGSGHRPTFGWCGPPMQAGSVLFRVEVEVVEVSRLP